MKDRNDIGEEVVCGYKISSARKKLWVIELDMLTMLEKTCKDNNINFFLLFGSAIGSVRHEGFIPWDDDIDIGMLREDFETFLTCDKKYFPEYIDIQYGISDHGVDPLLRIRDSRTTGIIKEEKDRPGNKGIFIEIYPFDYVNNNRLRKVQLALSKTLYNIMFLRYHDCKSNNPKDKFLRGITTHLTTEFLWESYNKICTLQNKKKNKCEFADTITLPYYAVNGHHLFRIEDIEESIYTKFEYTTTRIPKGYHRCLSTRYGEYMEMPPIEERGKHHENVVFYDPDTAYTEYKDSIIIERYFNGDNSVELL